MRKNVNGGFVNYYENERIIMGFTETGFFLNDLAAFFPCSRLVELEQIHSDLIFSADEIKQDKDGTPKTEGDGIILEKAGEMAIIKTADCTPLFFWTTDYTVGGVIHIGWQGLLKGIEKKLTAKIQEKLIPPENIYFHLGPAIEQKCYEVGTDLYHAFSAKSYRDAVFFPKRSGKKEKQMKYLMDVKKGIYLSLAESGIPSDNLSDSPLCTFCETGRFPSYRRDKATGRRIYNFLMLKPTEAAAGHGRQQDRGR